MCILATVDERVECTLDRGDVVDLPNDTGLGVGVGDIAGVGLVVYCEYMKETVCRDAGGGKKRGEE